jgi:SOS-response transcriptional repressor LexA
MTKRISKIKDSTEPILGISSKAIGARVTKKRAEMGLSLQEFGQKINVKPGFLSEIERGIKDVSRHVLQAMKTVDISSDYILFGESKSKDFNPHVLVIDSDRRMLEATEGEGWEKNYVPIPIAKDPLSGGVPRIVRENPAGVAMIYYSWVKNPDNFTAIWMVGESMEKTIPNGSLVGIDHSQKDMTMLDGKIVALTHEGGATVKKLKLFRNEKDASIIEKAYGVPENIDCIKDLVILEGESLNNAIIGKVAWWWARQS